MPISRPVATVAPVLLVVVSEFGDWKTLTHILVCGNLAIHSADQYMGLEDPYPYIGLRSVLPDFRPQRQEMIIRVTIADGRRIKVRQPGLDGRVGPGDTIHIPARP